MTQNPGPGNQYTGPGNQYTATGNQYTGPGNQYNTVSGGGNNYSAQNGNIIFNTSQVPPAPRGLRVDTKVLLGTLVFDVAFFFYGMLAYSGQNTSGDNWRAGLFIFLFFATIGMMGRWFRRRY